LSRPDIAAGEKGCNLFNNSGFSHVAERSGHLDPVLEYPENLLWGKVGDLFAEIGGRRIQSLPDLAFLHTRSPMAGNTHLMIMLEPLIEIRRIVRCADFDTGGVLVDGFVHGR
jgi:hypothetical protein